MSLIEYYISYFRCRLFIDNIKIIQKYIRMYLFLKHLRLLIHKNKSLPLLHDIKEFALLPPNPYYPLLINGGYFYRYHCDNFNNLYNILTNT